MIWAEAEGCRVVDAEGRSYIDLSGGFGVAALGHRNPEILAAVSAQADRCVHALGDLAEADVTVELRARLGGEGREAMLGVTGEDAVEIALRTALLVTGRPGIVAFTGAYHGTGLLALAATGFEQFRSPFAPWLPGPVHRRPYGDDPGPLPPDTACVIVEPIQGRAGAQVPPDGFLERLRERCDEAGALLVADEIYTGLGRTGALWRSGDVADLVTCGKALGGGLPISACLMSTEHRAAWDLGPEDVYTHTHMGNPLAAAAALVVLDRVPALYGRVSEAGERFEAAGWHGAGLLRAKEGDAFAAWERGVIVIPAGRGRPLHERDAAAHDHRRGDRRGAGADRMRYSWRFVVVAGFFVTGLVVSNIIAVKLVEISGRVFPAGLVIFPLSYVLGDVLTEVYGIRAARRVIWLGFACNLLALGAIQAAIHLPAADFWQENQAAYEDILGTTWRLFLASLAAYIVGELANAYVLAYMKGATQGRWLWTRTIGSTIVGEGLDSLIFVTIAFAGTGAGLVNPIVTTWLIKIGWEALATPITYWIVGYLKRTEGVDVYDFGRPLDARA